MVKISVIMRTCNSEKFLKHALESVLNQTLPKQLFEILVIDDGSVDGTKALLKNYFDKIRFIEKQGLGPNKAVNIGFKNALGEHVIIMDSDDMFESTILEEMLAVANEGDFVYCDYFELNEKTGEKKVVRLDENLFNGLAEGILFRKKALEKIGFYNENLIFAEYDLLMKLIEQYKGIYVSKPLFTYRRHRDSLSADQQLIERGITQLREIYGEKLPSIRDYEIKHQSCL